MSTLGRVPATPCTVQRYWQPCTRALSGWDARQQHEPSPDVWRSSRHLRTCAHTLATASAPESAASKGGNDASDASPENCDKIVAELRYRHIPVPSELDLSIGRRILNFAQGFQSAVIASYRFVASIPGGVAALSKMSLAEWREMLSGWWSAFVHEAKHYWVCMLPPSKLPGDTCIRDMRRCDC